MHTTVCSGKEIEPSSLRNGYFNHPCDTPSPNSWFVTSVIRNYPVDANSTNSLPQRSNIKKKTLLLFKTWSFAILAPGRLVGKSYIVFLKKICSQTVMFILKYGDELNLMVERMKYQLQQINKKLTTPPSTWVFGTKSFFSTRRSHGAERGMD